MPILIIELDVREVPGWSLQESLRDKQLLLVLDNFEQVASAALLVAALLTTCPHLNVLVTSQAALHLYGEYEFPVPPLSLGFVSVSMDCRWPSN